MPTFIEGLFLPVLFILVVVAGAVLGIVANVTIDTIDNNQKFTRTDDLVDANRNIYIAYILYFGAAATIIISIITHLAWTDAPSWLQFFLTFISFVLIVIGVIFMWLGYLDLSNISTNAKTQTLWALILGIVGAIVGIILVFVRGGHYIREQTIKTVKEEEPEITKDVEETLDGQEDIIESPPTTVQYDTDIGKVTTTTRKLDPSYPMMLE